MFLSKASNGTYYLFFRDDLGNRHAVSTRRTHKSDALKFLQQFREADHQRRVILARVSLSQFAKDYLQHSQSIHTNKTQKSNRSAFAKLQRILGDVPLHKITVKDVDRFLALKTQEASPWTVRKYHISLSAALEVAKRWGNVTTNPFRSAAKPKVSERQPLYFSRIEFRILLSTITDKEFRELIFLAASTGFRTVE